MSSPMKDARWNLATKMADGAGFVYEELPYETWQNLLDTAQMMLDQYGWMIAPEAKEWNTHE